MDWEAWGLTRTPKRLLSNSTACAVRSTYSGTKSGPGIFHTTLVRPGTQWGSLTVKSHKDKPYIENAIDLTTPFESCQRPCPWLYISDLGVQTQRTSSVSEIEMEPNKIDKKSRVDLNWQGLHACVTVLSLCQSTTREYTQALYLPSASRLRPIAPPPGNRRGVCLSTLSCR